MCLTHSAGSGSRANFICPLTKNEKLSTIIVIMKKISALGISALGYLSLAFPVFAQVTDVKVCPGGGFGALCNLTSEKFGPIVGVLIQIAFVLAVIIALAFLIYGGIRWITSGGDKTGVETARNTIVAALVGLVIVFLAFFILNIILGFFNLNLTDLKLPTLPGS